MRVLFVGEDKGQPHYMRRAIERLGHEVALANPRAALPRGKLIDTWVWHTGALFLSMLVLVHLRKSIGAQHFDAAFVDNGALISAEAVRWLKTRCRRVVLFNRDNPFSDRDGRRWRTLLPSMAEYDLYVTTRQSTAERARALGLNHVLRVNFFADETLHQPFTPSEAEQTIFGSPVSFVGTWFPERGPFMQRLIERGVPLKIIGNRWDRAENYQALRQSIVPGYLSSRQYAAAIRSSQIAIAMLSKGNEDLQTSRSSEIPALGVLLCAERTSEHMEMYEEGKEAVFWSTANECADICLELLANPMRLAEISAAGHRRVLRNDNWCEPIMERILQTAAALDRREKRQYE